MRASKRTRTSISSVTLTTAGESRLLNRGGVVSGRQQQAIGFAVVVRIVTSRSSRIRRGKRA